MSKDEEFKNIRHALTAGQFYPADASRLEYKIESYLKLVPRQKVDENIKALIVPHAGLDFSGQVAAHSYKLLEGKKIGTAVIICNSHSAYFDGIAVDEHDAWETPLGIVPVNQELAEKLVESDKDIKFSSEPFSAPDQTLEVQVPFLQIALRDSFKIVPIFFGNRCDDSYKKLARALQENLGKDDVVIISTDMSHYPAYEDANRIDKETLDIIKTVDLTELEEHIINIEGQNIPGEQTLLCGIDGVKTVMELYNLMNWDKVEILKYANSGDVPIGDKNSVVGYGAMVFAQIKNIADSRDSTRLAEAQAKRVASLQNDNKLNTEQKKELLKIVRDTVESYVREAKVSEFEVSDERLNWKEGAFVTIHKNGKLRGCIGQIMPSEKPLWEVVRTMAVSSCSEDHRFNPVSKSELEKLDYEVSVLSVPEKIDDWQEIELGKHGVIIRKGLRGGIFLPQVAEETGWSREEFLSQLCFQKAGLEPDCYKDKDVELQVFTAQVFGEK